MLSLDAMRKLRDAYDPYTGVSEADVLRQIGNPTRDVIIDTALEGLKSEDRNIRVLMLRVLAGQSGEKAIARHPRRDSGMASAACARRPSRAAGTSARIPR